MDGIDLSRKQKNDMTLKSFTILSALVGVITGFFTIHSPLINSWLSIFFWIVVGLGILYSSLNRTTALYAGATFGFFTIASWLISGFKGAQDKIGSFLMLTLVFSILGSVCGLIGAFVFAKLFKKA